jgi:hypothetical protein
MAPRISVLQDVPTVLGKPKIKKTKPSVPPPLPEVTRIMEMGFQRNQVEYAIKSLGKYFMMFQIGGLICPENPRKLLPNGNFKIFNKK